jgi:hypothetical protein
MLSSIICSPHAVVYINGKPFAHVSSFNFTDIRPHKTIYGIDSLYPLDTVPGPLSYNASMQLYRLRSGGGIEGDGLAPTWEAATRGKYFSILVLDRATMDILFEGRKNRITQQSWSMAAKQIVTGTVQFTGLSYNNNTVSPT